MRDYYGLGSRGLTPVLSAGPGSPKNRARGGAGGAGGSYNVRRTGGGGVYRTGTSASNAGAVASNKYDGGNNVNRSLNGELQVEEHERATATAADINNIPRSRGITEEHVGGGIARAQM